MVARPMTSPIFVRWTASVSVPGEVWSAALGNQLLVRVSVSIGRHSPRKR